MLARTAVLVVNTGVCTAVAAVLVIILLIAWPDLEIFTVPYAVICPLYCNTILANLNSRNYLRTQDTTVSMQLARISVGRLHVRSNDENTKDIHQLSILVQTTTELNFDNRDPFNAPVNGDKNDENVLEVTKDVSGSPVGV